MKKICVLGFAPGAAGEHVKTLGLIFGERVSMEMMCISEMELHPTDADVLVCTSSIFADQAKRYAAAHTTVIFADYTLECSVIQKIKQMCQTGPVSVVGSGYRITTSRKLLLESFGVEENALSIWYSGIGTEEIHHNVVVFGDTVVPSEAEHCVLRIPSRKLGVDTIVWVALALDCIEVLQTPQFLDYYHSVEPYFPASGDLIQKNDQYNLAGDAFTKGVLSFTQDYTVAMCDGYIDEIVGIPHDLVIEQKIYDLFPFLKKYIRDGGLEECRERVERYKGKDYIVNISLLTIHGTFIG